MLSSPAVPAEDRELLFKRTVGLRDLAGHHAQFLGGCGGRQAGSRDHERAAVLCDPEGGDQLGHTALVDPVLDLPHAVEREPANQARRDREKDGSADTHVQLGRDTVAGLKYPPESVVQGTVSRSVSTG